MKTGPDKDIVSYYKMQQTDNLQSFAKQDSLNPSKIKGGPYVHGHVIISEARVVFLLGCGIRLWSCKLAVPTGR